MTPSRRSVAPVGEMAVPGATTGERATRVARPMRADARRNRDAVLAAAADAFAAHGVEASLEDIARTAGVGIGTLYRHFPTREALVFAVYQREVDRLRPARRSCRDPRPRRCPARMDAPFRRLRRHQAGPGRMLKSMMGTDVRAVRPDQGSDATAAASIAADGAPHGREIRADISSADLTRSSVGSAWPATRPTGRTPRAGRPGLRRPALRGARATLLTDLRRAARQPFAPTRPVWRPATPDTGLERNGSSSPLGDPARTGFRRR